MPAHHPILESLDMLSAGSGLFRVDEGLRSAAETAVLEKHPWKTRMLAYLRDAAEFHADWVYFRLSVSAGAPRPEFYIYDWQQDSLSEAADLTRLANLYLELWNYGRVPLVLILGPTQVDFYNLLSEPTFDSDGNPQPPLRVFSESLSVADSLATAGAAAKGIATLSPPAWKRFSALQFDNGSFWEAPETQEWARGAKNSIDALVSEMREVRKTIEDSTDLDRPPEEKQRFVRRLLIITLMVRFLEDRGILRPDYFTDSEFVGSKRFSDLLRHPHALVRAITRMETDFNGNVFHLDPTTLQILIHAPESVTAAIADFAEGKTQGRQKLFWKRYSFRHIPVEVVSYVYEDFVGGEHQSYFTPHHLVDLLLDEAMPEKEIDEALKKADPRIETSPAAYPVLDPACGSGVFLVGAWRRLVESFCTIAEVPPADALKKLMVDNLFGVDLQEDSVELTIFSLCVALCSVFPADKDNRSHVFELLKKFQFPSLREKNLFQGDFFKVRPALLASDRRYRLIAGNPPFDSALETDEQKKLDRTKTDEDGKQWSPVADKQISYLFLRGVIPLAQAGGTVCMVQPSGILYNEKPSTLRKELIGNWNVTQILDFASIKKLFTTRKKPTKKNTETAVGITVAVFFVKKQAPDESKALLHATFRRTALLNHRQVFEVDSQDLHWLSRNLAASEPRIWKSDLLGGGRALNTFRGFGEETLGSYLVRMTSTRGWVSSEGFMDVDYEDYVRKCDSGNPPRDKPEHRADRLGWPLLETEGLNDSGLDTSFVKPSTIEWFLWPRDDGLFSPPHILIKELDTLPCVFRRSGDRLLFRSRMIGIAAPESDADLLQQVHDYVQSIRPYLAFFTAFGGQFLVGRQTALLKSEVLDLPFPSSLKLKLGVIQKAIVDDVMQFMIPLIKDTAETHAELSAAATREDVSAYAKVYAKMMQSAYPDFHSLPIQDLETGWCVAFWNGKGAAGHFGDTTALRTHLDSLLVHDKGRALRTFRIVRHFDGDAIYIVKPKARRYWLKSAAIRDADEGFGTAVHTAKKQRQPKEPERKAS